MLLDNCIAFFLNHRNKLLFLVTTMLVLAIGDGPPEKFFG